MSDRERMLRREIAEMSRMFEQAFKACAQPLIDELVEIEMRKPPEPIFANGQWHTYVGPTYDELRARAENR